MRRRCCARNALTACGSARSCVGRLARALRLHAAWHFHSLGSTPRQIRGILDTRSSSCSSTRFGLKAGTACCSSNAGMAGWSRRPAGAVQLRGVPGRIEFDTWSGEQLPLSDGSFDRVIVCAPWDAYKQPPVVLTEVARVLRLSGAAYLLTAGAPSATFYRALAGAALTEVASYVCENAPARCPGSTSPLLIHVRHRATS